MWNKDVPHWQELIKYIGSLFRSQALIVGYLAFLFVKHNGQMCEQNAQLFRFSLEPINNSGDNYADQ